MNTIITRAFVVFTGGNLYFKRRPKCIPGENMQPVPGEVAVCIPKMEYFEGPLLGNEPASYTTMRSA